MSYRKTWGVTGVFVGWHLSIALTTIKQVPFFVSFWNSQKNKSYLDHDLDVQWALARGGSWRMWIPK